MAKQVETDSTLHLSRAQIRVQQALDVANDLHRWQYRSKIAVPYIVHPLDVLKIITHEWHIDKKSHEDLWLAAILHDTLEDAFIGDERTVSADLCRLVGPGVYIAIVEELTFLGDDKEAYMASFREEKSLDAFIVKFADRIANVRDFLYTDPDYAPKYFQKAKALWEGLKIRKDLIVAEFGLPTYTGMDRSLLGLTLDLASAMTFNKNQTP